VTLAVRTCVNRLLLPLAPCVPGHVYRATPVGMPEIMTMDHCIWLWMAVTSMSLARNARINGLTSSPGSHR
jgi:hypothetical protein